MKERYNPRTGQYEPVPHENFRVDMRAGGVYVEDDHKMLSFFIKRGLGEIEIVRGTGKSDRAHPEKYVKKFTEAEARKIVDMIKRNVPRSKYKDYRYFCLNAPNPEPEKDAANEAAMQFVKAYGPEAAIALYDKYKFILEKEDLDDSIINESMRNDFHINEDDWFDVRDGRSTQGETKGTKVHGLKGFLMSLPSAAVSFMVNWPTALFNLVGSLRIRAEKRWKNTLLNPNMWKDFIQTPRPDKEKLLSQKEFDRLDRGQKDAYLHKMFVQNNKFYWAELSNGDVIRVIGISPEVAMENAIKTLQRIKPIYVGLNRNSTQKKRVNNDDVFTHTTYRVIFDDDEVSLWSGPAVDLTDVRAKESAVKDVKETSLELRKEVCNVYIESLLHEKPELNFVADHVQILKKYWPAVSRIEELGKGYVIEVPLIDRNNIIIHESYHYNSQENFGNMYNLNVGWFNAFIAATKLDDVEPIVKKFSIGNNVFSTIVQQNNSAFQNGNNGYRVKMSNGDIFYIYVDPMAIPVTSVDEKVRKAEKAFNTHHSEQDDQGNQSQEQFNKEEAIAKATAEVIEEMIITASKHYYRNVPKAATMFNTKVNTVAECVSIGTKGHGTDPHAPTEIKWPSDIGVKQVNPETRLADADSPSVTIHLAA